MKSGKSFDLLFIFILFALIFTGPVLAAEPIQSQMGPEDTELDLLQAKLNGKVLSVVLKVTAPADRSIQRVFFKLDEIFYIDAEQNRKYHILKDEKDKWLAGPLYGVMGKKDKYLFGIDYLREGKSGVLWMKFPAPLGDNPKIELNIPGVVPFSDITIANPGSGA